MNILDQKLTYIGERLGKIIPIRGERNFLVTETRPLREFVELDLYISIMGFPDTLWFNISDTIDSTFEICLNDNTYSIGVRGNPIKKPYEWREKLSKIFLSGFLTLRETKGYSFTTQLSWNRIMFHKIIDFDWHLLSIIMYDPTDEEHKDIHNKRYCLYIKDIIDAPSIFDAFSKNSPLPEDLNKMIFEDFVGGDEFMKFDMILDRIFTEKECVCLIKH